MKEFQNIRYVKQSSGYYRSTTLINGKRLFLHRIVYESAHGPIPEGFEVHHIDFNKDNNSPENLCIMLYSKHRSLHNKTDEFIKKRIEINKRPSFIQKIQASRKKLPTITKVCIECKEKFQAKATCGHKFCSKKCYFKWYNRMCR